LKYKNQVDLFFFIVALMGIGIAILLGTLIAIAGLQFRCRRHVPLWVMWAGMNGIAGAFIGLLEAGGMQFFATLILTGFIIGPAQWLVLRPWLPNPTTWLTASALGWILGILAQIRLSNLSTPLVQLLTSTVGAWEVFWLNVVTQPIILLVLGAVQWLVLRTLVPRAYWWVIGSAIAGMVKGAMGATTCLIICQGVVYPVIAGAISDGIAWIGYGLITGAILTALGADR